MPYNLLLIDDSAASRASMKRAIELAKVKAAVYEADSAKSAMAILAAAPIDLVLSDMSLPGMSAPELAYRMSADARMSGIPLVALCSQPNAARLAEVRNKGIRKYLGKPLTPYAVRKVVSELLESPTPRKAVA